MAVRKRSTKKRPGARRKRSKKTRRHSQWFRRWTIRLILLSLAAVAVYGLVLDYRIRSQFEGRRWALPARLYERPFEIYTGRDLTPDRFESALRRLGYSAVRTPRGPGGYHRSGASFDLYTRRFSFWDGEESARRVRLRFAGSRLDRLTNSDGTSLPILRLEPAEIGRIYPNHKEDRVLVRLEEVPTYLVQALLAVEDRKFRRHHGVDPLAVLRALWANLRAGRTVQGGSTLTQQLVKNYFLSGERSIARKLNEALMAVLLDLRYSKDEILEAYLNEIYLGQHGKRAIHGFGLAARFYFNRPLDELDLPRVALLVALVKGASFYNPRRHPKRARERRDRVIEVMHARGVISRARADQAKRVALGVTSEPGFVTSPHPAFVDLVRRQLRRDYPEDALRSEGLRIFTTLDPSIQAQAESSLSRGLKRLDRQKAGSGKLQGAVVVTDTANGEVLSVVGGRQARDFGFNRALDASRPIGSLVKPVVYLAALDYSGGYTLASRLRDETLTVSAPDGTRWTPANYDHREHGPVPLIEALARSYNLATVQLGLDLGLRKVIKTLQDLGVERAVDPYPSLLLGAIPLTPMEIARVYQTLANGGFATPFRAILAVTDADNQPLSRYRLNVSQAVETEPVYLLNVALTEVLRSGTGRGARSALPKGLLLAGKTGTTDDLRDSWFAGFGGNRLGVVWVGRDDNRPAGLTGGQGALKIWAKIMSEIDVTTFGPAVPDGVVWSWVDARSGGTVSEDCPEAVRLPFLEGVTPAPVACGGTDD